jgi:uncharacterized protein (DUF608 family)
LVWGLKNKYAPLFLRKRTGGAAKGKWGMNRREMLNGLGGVVALGLYETAGSAEVSNKDENTAHWPFRGAMVLNQWTQILADGFSFPVPGYVYEGSRLESGVPLGALGTGYMTLDGNGKLGFSSIFNDLVPPKKLFADWLVVEQGTRHIPLSAARIAYWGHYPVADLCAHLGEVPLEIGIRAFTPFIVGDSAASNTPVALFDLELRNLSDKPLAINLHLKFPSNPVVPADVVKSGELAVRGEGVVETESADGRYLLPVDLPSNGSRRVQFAVGWYAPSWRDSGSEPHINRYAQRFHSAEEVAEFGLRNRELLLRRVLAWQSEIYRSDLQEWLRDALVQGFYSLAKNSIWIARTRKDDWWGENGWFSHSESHTGCPIVETMVCRIHGHFALLFFFPELEETTLNAFHHYQISSGEIPFAFGTPTSMRDPRYTCQHPLNSGQYVQMVYQLYLRTGDRSILSKFYESSKQAIRFQYSLDDDDCGLVHDQAHARPGERWPGNQFYDIWPWQGTSSYVAGTWLATLSAGAALATAARDSSFAEECTNRLSKAQGAFERNLWNGSYYRLWNDKEAGQVSEVCLANQLMGVWCGRVAGLQDALPAAHIDAALDTIERLNMKATSYGLINGVTPDGKPFESKLGGSGDHAKNIFFGENLCAAMTFLYHGRRDTGLEVARRLYDAVAIKHPSPWNQRCLINGETGLPQWGEDYYSDLVIWALPMALAGQSVEQFARTGLAKNMITAAAKES